MSVLLAAKSTGRRLRTASLQQWDQHKPRPHMVQRAMQALEKALPPQWLQPMKLLGLGDWQKGAQHANGQPEWAACHDALAAIDDFASRHGRAAEWNLDDYEICQMARRLSAEGGALGPCAQAHNIHPAPRAGLVRP